MRISLVFLILAIIISCVHSLELPGFIKDALDVVKPKQVVCASGKLTCKSDESKEGGVLIKMWDLDRTSPRDYMTSTHTDSDGFFDFCGSARDPIGDIEPVLEIKHACPKIPDRSRVLILPTDSEPKPVRSGCHRYKQVDIPQSFIGKKYEMVEDVSLDEVVYLEKERCSRR